MNWTLGLTLFTFYILLVAFEDNLLRKKGAVNHRLHWSMRALVGIITAAGTYQNLWVAGSWALVLSVYLWIIFDLFENAFEKQNAFTYMGSGSIDLFYKRHFANPIFDMWITKIILLIIMITAHLIALGRYS